MSTNKNPPFPLPQILRERVVRLLANLITSGVLAGVALIIILLLTISYLYSNYYAPWTGFGARLNADGKTEPARTLWDWLQLLIVPAGLGIIALLFSRAQNRQQTEAAEKRAEQDHEIAADDRRERALQAYFDNMSILLLDKDLEDPDRLEKIRAVAQTRTHSVLRGLDPSRKSSVIRFLIDAKWINLDERQLAAEQKQKPFVDLRGARLQSVNLYAADLRGAHLTYAELRGASLNRAFMRGADLRGANLSDANLSGADLRGANLNRADLRGADLTDANLMSAKVAPEQLASVASLKGATMPDGSTYDSVSHAEPNDS